MIEINEKGTFKAPRGEKWNQLNLTARAVYIAIAANVSFKDGKCNFLSREKIGQIVGIKNVDDISKYTKQLAEAGFIEKQIKWVGPNDKRCIYKVLVQDNYTLVKNDIIRSGLSGKQIAMFCTIAAQRYDRSHRVKVTYESCGVSRQTFNKYISDLVELGIIEVDNDFVIFKKFVKCEDYKTNEKIQQMLHLDVNSREYRMAKYAIEHPKRLYNIDRYIDNAFSGTSRHSVKEKCKAIPF